MPGMKRGAADAPGYATLASLVPQVYRDRGLADFFWLPVGAVLLVATLDDAPFLQRLFTSRFALYLGDISFALYLVHEPLLCSYGVWLVPRLNSIEHDVGAVRYGLGVALCNLFFWPVLICGADLVTRFVDRKSVAFSRWAYGKLVK
ncbi:hypothetical protein IMZ48_14490 [Candidatus Bathyarchaeota archaeon]|nr:hypothetical protein [Candidatus Bathyarchaeota archaeon]